LVKRFALAAVLAGATLVATATASFADQRNFTVVNGSSIVLSHLFVSTTDTSSWEEDILGRDVLNPNESVDVYFSQHDGDAGQCLYDIKVVGQQGETGYLYKIDLCQTSTVTFNDQ
jgi:hypothetical protein